MAEREYEKTHPWFTFYIHHDRLPWSTWLKLGSIHALCNVIAGMPVDPDTRHEYFDEALLNGAWASASIEGNPLTLEQARGYYKYHNGVYGNGEQSGAWIEIENVLRLYHNSKTGNMTPQLVKEFNRQVMQGVEVAPWIVPGEISREAVGVGDYLAPPREDCEFLLYKMCRDFCFYQPERGRDYMQHIMPHPEFCGTAMAVIQASLVHLYLVWIHPFGDGNGRTARALERKLLVDGGVPEIVANMMSAHYRKNRDEYYRMMNQSTKASDGVYRFISFTVDLLLEECNRVAKDIQKYLANKLTPTPAPAYPAHMRFPFV